MQTEDLVLNDKLTALAQSWADHLAKAKRLEHSDLTYKDQPLGENIAEKQGTGHVDYTGIQLLSTHQRPRGQRHQHKVTIELKSLSIQKSTMASHAFNSVLYDFGLVPVCSHLR